jgi:TonB family protein
MSTRATLAMLLPLWLGMCVLANAEKKPPAKSEIQVRGEELLTRARGFSDIRTNRAPAFRLRATFAFVGKDLEKKEGSFTEVWVSGAEWRRETVVGDVRRVEVGGRNRRWLLDSGGDFPDTAAGLPDLINIFPAANRTFDFESITSGKDEKSTAECAITKPGRRNEKSAFCFDKKSGALTEKLWPEVRPMNIVSDSCLYSIFRKFGEFWFPREMACFEESHKKIDVTVEELALEPAPDTALFTPAVGAKELAECQGMQVPPLIEDKAQVYFPKGEGPGFNPVLLSLVVNREGAVEDLKVKRSGGPKFDEQALKAVRRWRYKPGTCDGEAMPIAINVEIDFH